MTTRQFAGRARAQLYPMDLETHPRKPWSSYLIAVGLLSCASLGVGCSDPSTAFGEGQGGEAALGGGGSGGAGEGGSTTSSGQGGAGGEQPPGPSITIRFRSSTAPFAHGDGLSGQTPLYHVSGVRKLQLFHDADDTDPFTVFDFGDDQVEISYGDGDDTVVVSVPASTLPHGNYSIARVVHTYVRYGVASTMHANGLDLPGAFDNLQVLSDGTTIDGTSHDHGYYEYVFTTNGMDFPTSGTDAPVPEWPETGGIEARLEQGEWSYYFAVQLALTPDVPGDMDLVFDVNMFESFRWQDQDLPAYQPGVFDTTPTSFEPVMRFGANSFGLTLE